MNRKIIGILGLVGLVLTGCAAPEVETEQTMMVVHQRNNQIYAYLFRLF